jgi:phospholipase C
LLGAVTVQEKIKHVVIIVQENRGFDNLFSSFPGGAYPEARFLTERPSYIPPDRY